MDRRRLLASLLALPASSVVVAETRLFMPTWAQHGLDDLNGSVGRAAMIPLVPSGPVTSRADGEIIENLDVDARFGDGITVVHRRVTVRNCRIRHAGGHGVHATNAAELVLQHLEIDHVGAPGSGAGP